MSFDFSKYAKKPEVKTIHYTRGVMGVMTQTDDPAESILSLKIRYISPREQNKIQAKEFDRKVISRKGAKAYVQDDENAKQAVAAEALIDFKMTVAGAELLQAQLDFEKLSGDQEIEHNAESREWFFKKSNLVGVILSVLSDHEFWYGTTASSSDDDEDLADLEGND